MVRMGGKGQRAGKVKKKMIYSIVPAVLPGPK